MEFPFATLPLSDFARHCFVYFDYDGLRVMFRPRRL